MYIKQIVVSFALIVLSIGLQAPSALAQDLSTLDDGLVGYYPFDIGFTDATGLNPNAGAAPGHAALLQTGGWSPAAGSGYVYLPQHQRLEIPAPHQMNFGAGSFTVLTWMRVTSYNQQVTVLGNNPNAVPSQADPGFHVRTESNGNFSLRYATDTTAMQTSGQFHHFGSWVGGTNVTNRWSLVGLVVDVANGTVTAYGGASAFNSAFAPISDGLITLRSNVGPAITFGGSVDNAYPFFIGGLDANYDELALWNRALTPAEVAEYYNNGEGLDLRTILPPPAPEIEVVGNSVSIADGATTATSANDTDFGNVEINTAGLSHTFSINNTGTSTLTLGADAVSLSGAGSAPFTVDLQPDVEVSALNSTDFTLTFAPTTADPFTATVSIANDDADESPFTFVVAGQGALPPPALAIDAEQVKVSDNLTFTVPVSLTLNGNVIPSVGFSIDYDESCISFSESDADSDGLFDAIQHRLPASFVVEATHLAADTDGELDIAIYYFGAMPTSLSDGVLVELEFAAKLACVTTDGSLVNLAFNFSTDPAPEFADAESTDVPGTATDATVPLQFNAYPSAIALSATTVAENLPGGTTVGTLSTTDLDTGDSHTYSLTGGDVGDFALNGADLETTAAFNYEVKNSYAISVTTDDGHGGTFEAAFTITINDLNDAPIAVDDPDVAAILPIIAIAGLDTVIDVLANDSDEDPADTLSVSAVGAATHGTVTNISSTVTYAPTDATFNGSDSFTYTATDDNSLGALTDTATVDVAVVANDPPGDCNTSSAVGIADIIGIVLEYFDGDSNNDWWLVYQGSYAGSPLGCNANSDGVVGLGDISCTVLVFFGDESCTQEMAAASTLATADLTVAGALAAAPGSTINVPIQLTSNGNAVSAAGFTLDFDATQLHFDPTDANRDGLPDAITFQVPEGITTYANYNADRSRIEVALYHTTVDAPMLGDHVIATVALQVNPNAAAGPTALDLRNGSLGDDNGREVPVVSHGAVVTIGEGAGHATQTLFLPLVQR